MVSKFSLFKKDKKSDAPAKDTAPAGGEKPAKKELTFRELLELGDESMITKYIEEEMSRLTSTEAGKSIKHKILTSFGEKCHVIGMFDVALKYFNEALEIAEEKDDIQTLGQVYRKMGNTYVKCGKSEMAKEYFDKGLEHAEKLDDFLGIAESHIGLGHAYWRTSDHDTAIDEFNKGIEFATKVNNRNLIGRVNIEIGNVYNHKGEIETSKEYYLNAISILKELNNHIELSRAYNNLGDVHMTLEKWDEAIGYFTESVSSAEKAQSLNMKAWAMFNTAECYAKMKELDKAKEYNEKAYYLLKSANDKIGVSAVYRNKGLILGLEENYEDAEDNFKKSITILEENNVPFELGYAYYEYSLTMKNAGNAPLAQELLGKARKIFEGINSQSMIEKLDVLASEIGESPVSDEKPEGDSDSEEEKAPDSSTEPSDEPEDDAADDSDEDVSEEENTSEEE